MLQLFPSFAVFRSFRKSVVIILDIHIIYLNGEWQMANYTVNRRKNSFFNNLSATIIISSLRACKRFKFSSHRKYATNMQRWMPFVFSFVELNSSYLAAFVRSLDPFDGIFEFSATSFSFFYSIFNKHRKSPLLMMFQSRYFCTVIGITENRCNYKLQFDIGF